MNDFKYQQRIDNLKKLKIQEMKYRLTVLETLIDGKPKTNYRIGERIERLEELVGGMVGRGAGGRGDKADSDSEFNAEEYEKKEKKELEADFEIYKELISKGLTYKSTSILFSKIQRGTYRKNFPDPDKGTITKNFVKTQCERLFKGTKLKFELIDSLFKKKDYFGLMSIFIKNNDGLKGFFKGFTAGTAKNEFLGSRAWLESRIKIKDRNLFGYGLIIDSVEKDKDGHCIIKYSIKEFLDSPVKSISEICGFYKISEFYSGFSSPEELNNGYVRDYENCNKFK